MRQGGDLVPGDSVRLRYSPSSEWTAGRLVRTDSGQVVLRQITGDKTHPAAGLERIDVWRYRNTVLEVLSMGAAGALGSILGQAISGDSRRPFTGSKGSDVAVFAGAGMLVGVVYVMASPGSWHKVRLGLR